MRIAPLDPPYRPELQAQFDKLMRGAPPLALFRQASMAAPQPNQLVISIQPEETITLRLSAKVPGPQVAASPVEMRFNYEDHFGLEQQTGYETLLYDAMVGDRSLFKRADIIELSWSIVDQILQGWSTGSCPLARYSAGSSGPWSSFRSANGRRLS